MTAEIGAFAAALRRRQFSKPDERPLGASTVEEAVAKLGQIFRANVGFNPAHGDSDGGIHPSLSRQFRGMKNSDPSEKSQKALPVCIYHEIYQSSKLKSALCSDINISWLKVLACFFCMRSCEYSNVNGERRTKHSVLETSTSINITNSSQTTHQEFSRQHQSPLPSSGKRRTQEMIQSPTKNQMIKSGIK